jgi:peptide/nickel transport system ATP-binding protein
MTASKVLEVRDLRVTFPSHSVRGRARITAVDGVNITLAKGESLGLVGESGCGKSTLARAIVGQISAEAGQISVDGLRLGKRRSVADRRRMQMVFQDPSSALNPQMRVQDMLMELMRVHGTVPSEERLARCRELVAAVGLPVQALHARPGGLSGGQRQRIGIARALAVDPDILIADEITSALDVSIQAQVLQLLIQLRETLDLSLLFISHNLAVIRQVCDRVAVMYLGRIVEEGPTEKIFTAPRHPYTRLLLASIPRLSGAPLPIQPTGFEPPNPGDVPSGCRFRGRCPQAQAVCATVDPGLSAGGSSHFVACHFALSEATVVAGS